MWKKRMLAICLSLCLLLGAAVRVRAEDFGGLVLSPSYILMEASTGQVIAEQNATEHRSPASVTKVMTLLLTFDEIEAKNVSLEDEVVVSEYASSMGGSQVFLAQGEVQTLETMIKCIVVASGNDASVAVAEHVAGSEAAFVKMMNERAAGLGMKDTHFVDCCGLTDSDDHYTTARDVALMSRELITRHPQVLEYSKIWMEDITHVTKQGSSVFTLSSTNKLLKQYPYTTGLKTGFTSKAMYCISATAAKDGIDLIAVVMGAPDSRQRNQDVQTLLNYGFRVSRVYVDANLNDLPELSVEGGMAEKVPLIYEREFRYLDTKGRNLDRMEKRAELPESVSAPVKKGEIAGWVHYILEGVDVGQTAILYEETVEKAGYRDYLNRAFHRWLIGRR